MLAEIDVEKDPENTKAQNRYADINETVESWYITMKHIYLRQGRVEIWNLGLLSLRIT